MTKEDISRLEKDPDGLITYEYLANHLENMSAEELDAVIDNMARVDLSAQYLASGARYLHALDGDFFATQVKRMVALTIDRDREHRYIADLMTAIYGTDYTARAVELATDDNNFRRMYKRLYPEGII